jgi:hypothetical protein
VNYAVDVEPLQRPDEIGQVVYVPTDQLDAVQRKPISEILCGERDVVEDGLLFPAIEQLSGCSRSNLARASDQCRRNVRPLPSNW